MRHVISRYGISVIAACLMSSPVIAGKPAKSAPAPHAAAPAGGGHAATGGAAVRGFGGGSSAGGAAPRSFGGGEGNAARGFGHREGPSGGEHHFGGSPGEHHFGDVGERRFGGGHAGPMYHDHEFSRIHGDRYRWPHGGAYRRWEIGRRLPREYWLHEYFVDYELYGLEMPPPGYQWVRYGPDLLLISLATGAIAQSIYGAYE